MADAVGAIRTIGAIVRSTAAVGRPTSTVNTFAIAILAAGHAVAVAIVGTPTQIVWIKTLVVSVTEPVAWALLVEVAGSRRGAA